MITSSALLLTEHIYVYKVTTIVGRQLPLDVRINTLDTHLKGAKELALFSGIIIFANTIHL